MTIAPRLFPGFIRTFELKSFSSDGRFEYRWLRGMLRNILVLFEMVDELINEAFLPQKSLTPYLGPDGILPDPRLNERSVLLLRLTPFPAELAQHPVCSQAQMGLCFARSSQVT